MTIQLSFVNSNQSIIYLPRVLCLPNLQGDFQLILGNAKVNLQIMIGISVPSGDIFTWMTGSLAVNIQLSATSLLQQKKPKTRKKNDEKMRKLLLKNLPAALTF